MFTLTTNSKYLKQLLHARRRLRKVTRIARRGMRKLKRNLNKLQNNLNKFASANMAYNKFLRSTSLLACIYLVTIVSFISILAAFTTASPYYIETTTVDIKKASFSHDISTVEKQVNFDLEDQYVKITKSNHREVPVKATETEIEAEVEIETEIGTKSRTVSSNSHELTLFKTPTNTNEYTLPQAVYLHWDRGVDAKVTPPQVVNSPLSEDDIFVDTSNHFDEARICNISSELKKIFSIIVFLESGNQPFEGQVSTAEDVRNSCLFSGDDPYAVLANKYYTLIEEYSDGTLHAFRKYDDEYVEVTDTSEACEKAVELALQGSIFSNRILEAVTNIRNEQYPHWNLDDSFYSNGARYHYVLDGLSSKAIENRRLNRVPVSYVIDVQFYYGLWLPASMALNL